MAKCAAKARSACARLIRRESAKFSDRICTRNPLPGTLLRQMQAVCELDREFKLKFSPLAMFAGNEHPEDTKGHYETLQRICTE
jgi:hypothetical protein